MILLQDLTKRYGEKTAVARLSVKIAPGKVTGFLGPNGAGKSTTMRLITGLDAPSAGTATISGRPYAAIRHPLREVGALLDAGAAHPGRTARSHLLALARSNGIAAGRVAEVLELAGLTAVAGKRIGSYSLGMRQRLGIATALLGDPEVLLFDEPVNGLDPDGVRWIRDLVRSLAAEGRTVLLSSHLMSEMQETADHLVVLGRGHLVADAPLDEVIGRSSLNAVRVRSPRAELLRRHLLALGMDIASGKAEEIMVTGCSPAEIGDLAFRHGIPLHELSPRQATLEEAYMELTLGSVEYGERKDI